MVCVLFKPTLLKILILSHFVRSARTRDVMMSQTPSCLHREKVNKCYVIGFKLLQRPHRCWLVCESNLKKSLIQDKMEKLRSSAGNRKDLLGLFAAW